MDVIGKLKAYGLLPFESITLASRHPADRIIERLSALTSPRKSSILGIDGLQNKPPKPFEGVISGLTFELSSMSGYRNMFSPILLGVVAGIPGGSEIRIRMRMSYYAIAFISIWLGVSAIAALAGLATFLLEGGQSSRLIVGVGFPLAFFVFGYLTCIAGYKVDSRNVKAQLSTIFSE